MNQIFKTSIMTAVFLSAYSAGMVAVPAIPDSIKVLQADGTELTVKVKGDENGFSVYSSDDIPLMLNSKGMYERCSVRPTTPMIRTARKVVNSDGEYLRISNYPTIGHQKALVILVEFADRRFSTVDDAYGYYDAMLNEPGFTHENGAEGSARDYFRYSSHGLFDPEFVVVGPVRLRDEASYYGGDTEKKLDSNAWQMIEEACLAVDDEVDFSEFDADGDGNVDSIYFFYAGFGQADSLLGDTIWPHNGLLKDNWGVDLVLDGKRINNYACSNEIRFNSSPNWMPVGIGTFVHEFGHVLGLVDHYDTSYGSGRTGVNQWDTMAAASYLNNQNTPPAFSAYERAALGWMTLDETDPLCQAPLRFSALNGQASNAVRLTVPETDRREFFVIERRDKSEWDRMLPAEGVLVWHITEDGTLWDINKVNADPAFHHIDIVEADGTENEASYKGDTFPGSANVTSFDFIGSDGQMLFAFDHVARLGDESVVLLAGTKFIPESPRVTVSDVYGSSFILRWEECVDALGYLVTITDIEGECVDSYEACFFDSSEEIKLTGLIPNNEYIVDVRSVAGSYVSESNPLHVFTGDLEFFESRPEGVEISDVREGGFTVSWIPLDGADDYGVTLFDEAYGTPEEFCYGFDEGLDGMPEGWSTTTGRISRSMFGDKTPSLQMSSDRDELSLECSDAVLTRLRFYWRSQNHANRLVVESYDSDGGMLDAVSLEGNTSGGREDIKLPEKTTRVTVRFHRSAGYIVIDDVILSASRRYYAPLAGFNDMRTAGADSMRIDYTDFNESVKLSVTGYCQEIASLPSEMMDVDRTLSVEVISDNAAIGAERIYDLNGREVSEGNPASGVYIVRKGIGSRKIMVRNNQ